MGYNLPQTGPLGEQVRGAGEDPLQAEGGEPQL